MAIALNASLIAQLARREIAGRYRGSALGILWSMLSPLFMLATYTFVFGTVFRARWAAPAEQGASGANTAHSTSEFAIILFAGLIVFQLFAEVVTRAPTLIVANTNYVKKVIFPLEILPIVALGSALFHTAVSLLVLFACMLVVFEAIPLTALLAPLVLAPFCVMILGVSWFLASLGVYYRDINQFLGTFVTALLFLSPIFYPISALPDWVRAWVVWNPIALPVEQIRNMLIFGQGPDLPGLLLYTLAAFAMAGLGYAWFRKTRKGFADVL